jgi:hypothetical protein
LFKIIKSNFKRLEKFANLRQKIIRFQKTKKPKISSQKNPFKTLNNPLGKPNFGLSKNNYNYT